MATKRQLKCELLNFGSPSHISKSYQRPPECPVSQNHGAVDNAGSPQVARGGIAITLAERARPFGLAREGVARIDFARFQAGVQPLHTLRRRAMGEGIGHGKSLRRLLQTIVADRLCGRDRRL